MSFLRLHQVQVRKLRLRASGPPFFAFSEAESRLETRLRRASTSFHLVAALRLLLLGQVWFAWSACAPEGALTSLSCAAMHVSGKQRKSCRACKRSVCSSGCQERCSRAVVSSPLVGHTITWDSPRDQVAVGPQQGDGIGLQERVSWVGSRVRKCFRQHGFFMGTVWSYYQEIDSYEIHYDDDDFEELDFAAMKKIVVEKAAGSA
jgi:hypothetical protein